MALGTIGSIEVTFYTHTKVFKTLVCVLNYYFVKLGATTKSFEPAA